MGPHDRISALKEMEADQSSVFLVITQQEGSHMQTRKRVLSRHGIHQHMDLGLPRS